MDMVHLGREISGTFAAVGFGLSISPLVLLVLYYVSPMFFLAYNLVLFIVYMSMIGLLLFTIGSLFWAAYQISELYFLKKYHIDSSVEYDYSRSGELWNVTGTLQPAFLIDSMDREVLQIITSNAGDILAVKNQMKTRALFQDDESMAHRLSNLINLQMVTLYKGLVSRRLFLTPLGHEAINTPSAVFSSKIPLEVRNYLYEMKRQITLEKWAQSVLEAHKAIESAYKIIIRNRATTNSTAADMIKEFEKGRRTAGRLHQMLEQLKVLRASSFERWLSNQITGMRPASHDSADARVYTSEDAIRCEQYLGILMRILFA